jgi:hypothetical protein
MRGSDDLQTAFRPRSRAYQTVWQVSGLDELTEVLHVSWEWISVCLTAGHSVARSSHRSRLTPGSMAKRSPDPTSADLRPLSLIFATRPVSAALAASQQSRADIERQSRACVNP